MRKKSFGEKNKLTLVDKIGVFLSLRKITSFARRKRPLEIIDIGCGYNAVLLQHLKRYSNNLTGIDIKVNPEISRIKIYERNIERDLSFLEDSAADLIILNSVLEHLDYPQEILKETYRILKEEGTLILNVPNWLGKYFLEFSAFRLGFSPKEEMNDHKMYYGKKDLWPMLVRSGFKPENIKMKYHKLFLNTLCYAKK